MYMSTIFPLHLLEYLTPRSSNKGRQGSEDLLTFKFGARSRCLGMTYGEASSSPPSSRIAKHRCHWLWALSRSNTERLKSRSARLPICEACMRTATRRIHSASSVTHPHRSRTVPIRVGETDRKRSLMLHEMSQL